MMKRAFTLYALVAILGVATYASDRTEAEMRAIAGQQLFGALSKGTGPAAMNVKLEKKFKHLSVYSAEGLGFVVVSRDDTFPAILGKSTTAIDMDNLPDGFCWWLEEANNSIQRRLDNGDWYTPLHAVTVEPFLTTKWDQVKPYNLLCPKIATDNCPTGCVATAAAQVMKYYNYPEQGEGTASYKKNGLPKTKEINSVYDWANMKNTYAKTQTKLTTETEAVATLMADVGAACGMEYTGNYGGTSFDQCARGLIHNMKYDSLSLRCLYRSLFNDMEWTDMIYTELTNKRPVLYGGTPLDGSSGHAFVFHGLDADGKVYVNWGWSGTCDGYYDIHLLQPGKDAVQKGDYTANGHMIINFNPTQTPEEGTEEISFWGTDTLSYFTLKDDSLVLNASSIFNFNYRDFRGLIVVAMENTNGVEDDNVNIILYDTEDEEGEPIEPFYGFGFADEEGEYGHEAIFSMLDDEIKPGTYIVTLGTIGIYESQVSPMRYIDGVKCQAKLVKGADGSLELTDYTPTAIQDVKRTVCPNTSTSKIYDLRGRQVTSTPSHRGIYIIGGKKVIR